jgi:hypothetical protein
MKFASHNSSFFRAFFAISAATCALAAYQTQVQTEALFKFRTRYKWALLIGLFCANLVAGLYMALGPRWAEALWTRLEIRPGRTAAARLLGVVAILVPVAVFWSAREDFFGRGLEAFFRLTWLFWWLCLIQAAGLKRLYDLSWPVSMACVILGDGLAAQIYTAVLPISNYPFSIGWSEASRFYYGSLVFSNSVYGAQVPLSVWHGTRYLMLSLPFVFQGVSLLMARAWQVLLWLAVTGLCAWSLARRASRASALAAAIIIAWFLLFLFQGAVYYHLEVCVIVILLGVRRGYPWRSLLAILFASFWAGMSRLNWYPVPAMLAISIYFLEEPVSKAGSLWRYVRTPAVWAVLGMLAALAGQAFYIAISGNGDLRAFGSSLTSALLWYRWLPSATNPIGVLPGVLIVSLPLWYLGALALRLKPAAVHPVRFAGVLAMLAVLLAGGLIVSTKIGGGGDLHNMDAYLVLLGLAVAYFFTGGIVLETGEAMEVPVLPWASLSMVVLVPAAFALLHIGTPFSYDPSRAALDLARVGEEVRSYGEQGPVLFIYERQLLTFGLVPRVPLVPDYEVVSLMEMAISGNRTYLDQYYRDLETHRFAAIVAHPQNLGVETGDFIEENNVWSRLVAQPLLCQYKPAVTLPYSRVQILIPRARPCPEFPPKLP